MLPLGLHWGGSSGLVPYVPSSPRGYLLTLASWFQPLRRWVNSCKPPSTPGQEGKDCGRDLCPWKESLFNRAVPLHQFTKNGGIFTPWAHTSQRPLDLRFPIQKTAHVVVSQVPAFQVTRRRTPLEVWPPQGQFSEGSVAEICSAGLHLAVDFIPRPSPSPVAHSRQEEVACSHACLCARAARPSRHRTLLFRDYFDILQGVATFQRSSSQL